MNIYQTFGLNITYQTKPKDESFKKHCEKEMNRGLREKSASRGKTGLMTMIGNKVAAKVVNKIVDHMLMIGSFSKWVHLNLRIKKYGLLVHSMHGIVGTQTLCSTK